MNLGQRRTLARRSVLRGAGVALGLPLLEAMLPRRARAAAALRPACLLAVCNNLGLLGEHFFPTRPGRDYEPSPYLSLLARHRESFTVMSGVSHPDVDGGHPADICFLTAAAHPGRGGFRNSISLDQFAAEHIGHLTRFPSLSLGVNVAQGNRGLSWTGAGVLIPSEEKASEVFKRLFVAGTKEEVAAQERRLNLGRSILDAVTEQARTLARDIAPRDRERLDQYLTGVRDLERRLVVQKEWERKPKPVVTTPGPDDAETPRQYFEKLKSMYDVARLAFETDSTRLITLMIDSVSSPAVDVPGVQIKDGYHNLSHHGKSAEKLAQLRLIDEQHMRLIDGLLTELGQANDGGRPLLDRAMFLYGSNLGNANTHVTTNLPLIFAGGGFRHGQHLAFDRVRNYPLPNLFVSILHRLGIELDRFASSTGTMRGLELRV